MYFLLYGSILVTRKDAEGVERELVTMSAPALLGHMALVDNSPRSATCRVAGTTRIAMLDRRLYNTILSESTSRGTALRRMLLTSLTRQLESATGRLRRLIAEGPNEAAPAATSGKAEQELNKITGMLNGWTEKEIQAADEVEVVYDENQKAAQRERNRRS
jgi:CRP-like cAMP-binding protein